MKSRRRDRGPHLARKAGYLRPAEPALFSIRLGEAAGHGLSGRLSGAGPASDRPRLPHPPRRVSSSRKDHVAAVGCRSDPERRRHRWRRRRGPQRKPRHRVIKIGAYRAHRMGDRFVMVGWARRTADLAGRRLGLGGEPRPGAGPVRPLRHRRATPMAGSARRRVRDRGAGPEKFRPAQLSLPFPC
jgi:hypothetical protein